ncbi:DUF6461 domain-containing protein [Planotetraspora sp. A-T 1434]|uniref:DUF6461 domain-containing protein n=1 Tax=Planotetraspora sp. A-T 1434 TaxID=2979219 RepID=UPI0021C04DBB|nr:DUF6461 domain-containing protein [Planotetraspora sp. A-T 1434]MCT9934958.1 DUF6461 domain-containing protein [Planotetraspora sp. A-T 1434]
MSAVGKGEATTSDYAWWSRIRGPEFCFTFAAGLAPDDVLHRLHLSENREQEGPFTIEVGRADGGSIMVEWGGIAGILRDVVRDLSPGTSIASLTRDVNHRSHFIHAIDGRTVTHLDPMFPHWAGSAEPERLRQDLEELGMIPEIDPDDDDGFFPYHIEGALALTERCTGVRLEPRHLQRDTLPHRASIARYYNRSESEFPELAWPALHQGSEHATPR